MKELESLNGDGNKVTFIRGNDGDLHIIVTIPSKKAYLETIRVGVGNSGRQEVPVYVKEALSNMCDAMQRWDNEENTKPYYRFGDLLPDTFPSRNLIDLDTKEKMMQVREKLLEGTEDLRKGLSWLDGTYVISNSLGYPMKLEGNINEKFRDYLFSEHLLFRKYEDCQEVINEMLKIKKSIENEN